LTLASDPQYTDLMKDIRGWVLESPLIALPKGYEPSPVVVFFGRIIGRVMPHKQRLSALPPENLTRDPEVVKSIKQTSFCMISGHMEALLGCWTGRRR